MEPVHFAIAAIPVAIYFMLIGSLRLRRKPLVTTGWRDTMTLGVAVSGLIAIGPAQLFFPRDAAAIWSGWVWIALLLLYVLALMLVLLSCKPRLIAYGMDHHQFTQALLDAAQEVDGNAHWNGEVLNLPTVNLQLVTEQSGTSRVHQVVLVGMLTNFTQWMALEKAFVRIGGELRCPRSAAGLPFVIGGLLLLGVAVLPMLEDPNEALAQLRELLNRN